MPPLGAKETLFATIARKFGEWRRGEADYVWKLMLVDVKNAHPQATRDSGDVYVALPEEDLKDDQSAKLKNWPRRRARLGGRVYHQLPVGRDAASGRCRWDFSSHFRAIRCRWPRFRRGALELLRQRTGCAPQFGTAMRRNRKLWNHYERRRHGSVAVF